jgi:hypothetical protein
MALRERPFNNLIFFYILIVLSLNFNINIAYLNNKLNNYYKNSF